MIKKPPSMMKTKPKQAKTKKLKFLILTYILVD
jgi:hypothetical protein